MTSPAENKPRATLVDADALNTKAKERFVFEAAMKIRELKKELSEKDQQIRELRSGGVGISTPLPPPDAEALLDAFQERYFDARFQIRQFELQILELEKKGANASEMDSLRLKMSALANREQAWIKKIAATVESFREAKRKPGTSG
jgi:hypothetical protein